MSILIVDISKVRYSYILPFVFLGFYVLLLFGTIRNNPVLLFSNPKEIAVAPFKEQEPVTTADGKKIIFSHQGDVYYASARMIGLVKTKQLDPVKRIEAFIGNALSIFLPSKFFPEHVKTGSYLQNKYGTGGGGLISVYFYTFLGYLGVVLVGLWLGYLINKSRTSPNQFFILYFILVISTYPRWFAYSPITMFKLCFWIIPVYLIIQVTIDIIKNHRNKLSPSSRYKEI